MTGPGDWAGYTAARLQSIRDRGQWRAVRTLDGGGPGFTLDGRAVVSFASNDYLGLSQHPAVVAAAVAAAQRWGAGSGASRLVVGARPVHDALEAELARAKGTERALLFPTGYAANLGVLATLGAGARIVSDELNHASIIDGCRLARTEVHVFRHGDLDEAAGLVASAHGRVLVVSDTVFSMDGDLADLAGLSALCARTGALLLLDDAHAVLGDEAVDPGAGVVRVGTLSKTLGALGGYVAGDSDVIDLLVNSARSFIFTTAPAPGDTAAALHALRIWRSAEGAALVDRLRRHVERVRPGHRSPIVPVVLGDEDAAVAAAAALLADGLLVPAIRPPTVPPGTSRLRVALSAAHTDDEVERLRAALGALRPAARTSGRPGSGAW